MSVTARRALQFYILGPLRVGAGGDEVDLGSPAQRALLGVLLTSPNAPVSEARLIDELWGDAPPPSAHHLLQVYASRLRSRLDDGADGSRLVREGAGYMLRVSAGEIDADRFAEMVAHAQRLQRTDPDQADSILADSLRLWRGVPLADLPETPAVREHAAYLERQHLDAQLRWAEMRLEMGAHRELVPELARLVEHHPYDEALHAQLMLALYRSGRQADALATGRGLQARLRDELGVDPSPAVRELYRDMLLQAPHLSLEPPEPPGNLPKALTSFVGGVDAAQGLSSLIDAHRLVTLVGTGGIGKTRLAMEVAQRKRAEFPGGVWWVDLATITNPESVLDVVARVLGLPALPGVALLDALVRSLHRRRVLLVFDNCEHLAVALGSLVSDLLQRTGAPRIIATSRVALRIQGEWLFEVPPLGLPPKPGAGDGSVQAENEADAVRLLVERGSAADPAFRLTPSNADSVAELCRGLDGLPLAIEMAAARLRVLSPRELVARLDQRFQLLELSELNRPARHRSMAASIETSLALLPESERILFERLSVFAGAFDLASAAAVGLDGTDAGEIVSGMSGLVTASMAVAEHDGERTRYRLPETLREYGLARLREYGQEEATRQAHADHFLDLAAAARVHLGTPEFAIWFQRLTDAYGEIREALGWSLAHDDRVATLRAVPALRELWYRRADAREAGRWAARLLDGCPASVPPDLLAELHIASAFAANLAIDLESAARHADEAARLFREAGSLHELAWALWGRAHVALAAGDHDTGRSCATEALQICDRIGDRWGRAGPLTILGFISLFGGAPQAALPCFEEALPLYRELGDRGGLVNMVLTPLSVIALRMGDLESAEHYATEALEAGRGTGWEVAALVCYGEVQAALGDPASAEAVTKRGLRVALDTGSEIWFRHATRDLARLAADAGRFDQAAQLLAASRPNMPAYGLDPAIYGPVEERCRRALGDERFERLCAQGEAMSHDEIIGLVA